MRAPAPSQGTISIPGIQPSVLRKAAFFTACFPPGSLAALPGGRFCVNVNSREDRRDARGAGGPHLGTLVSDRRPGRITRPRLALALGPFLQPDGPPGAARTGVLDLTDGTGSAQPADRVRPTGQPHDLSAPGPARADGRRGRWPV